MHYPDEVHGDVHSEVVGDLVAQFRAHDLRHLLKADIEKVTVYGAIRTNPDIIVTANCRGWPWDANGRGM